MFQLADASKIGEYLANVMIEKYGSKRKFCQAYIEYEGGEATDDETRKLANRITQITKGNKGIQTYDLPIFCNLLDMSCEQILSAGSCFAQQSQRVTNYSVALSGDEKIWADYINREDKLFLNPDEYGNTVIDYALDFKNYAFIRYLLDKGYIWFDSRKDNDYVLTFGAGTSIKKRDPIMQTDTYLPYTVLQEDQLRMDVIALAVENEDKEVLDSLRAREIPELYYKAHYLSCTLPDIDQHRNDGMIEQIASASDGIVDYFTEAFTVRDRVRYKDGSNRAHTFIFPYISELLDLLVENNHPFLEFAIRKCMEHNAKTYDILKGLIDKSIEERMKDLAGFSREYLEQLKPGFVEDIFRYFDFSENGNVVCFRAYWATNGIITNIAHIKAASKDTRIQYLIRDLNMSFERIANIKSEYISKKES